MRGILVLIKGIENAFPYFLTVLAGIATQLALETGKPFATGLAVCFGLMSIVSAIKSTVKETEFSEAIKELVS